MADKITWADKESLVTDPTIDEKNKVTDANMNEIKNSVNANADQLDETIVIGDSNITNNTKEVINEVDYIPYINSEIAIGPTNPQNQRTWFKQGKNLLPKRGTQIISGITITEQTDGSLILNGTANANVSYYYCGNDTTYESLYTINKGGKYTLSSTTATGYFIYIMSGGSVVASLTNGGKTTFTATANATYRIFIRVSAGVSLSNIHIYPQLEKGSTATTYEAYVNPSINIDEQEIYNKPVVLVTTQNVTYDSSSQDGSAVFTLQFPTGFNASNTIVVSLGWKYHSDTNNEWRFGTIAGSDVKPNPFFVTFNYNNTPGIRVRFDDVEAEVTYSADFKIVLMKVD